MTKEVFQFKIGQFDCISLNDGYHDYRIETFFPNVERHDLEKALRSRNWPIDRVSTPYASLYVDTGEHHVLNALVLGMHFPPFPCLGHIIETGEGLQWQHWFPRLPKSLDENLGRVSD